MKSKNFSKKLTLNKTTIADLKNDELKVVQGGVPLSTTAVSVATNCCHCHFTPTC
jgi:hypothetical protein